MSEQLKFVHIHRPRVLPDVAGVVNAARKPFKIAGFNRFETPDGDLGGCRNLLQAQPFLAPLRGGQSPSPDIRAGQASLIAALSADGKSTIQNIEQIDRGYQYIDERLSWLGAEIKRV